MLDKLKQAVDKVLPKAKVEVAEEVIDQEQVDALAAISKEKEKRVREDHEKLDKYVSKECAKFVHGMFENHVGHTIKVDYQNNAVTNEMKIGIFCKNCGRYLIMTSEKKPFKGGK